MPLCSIYAYIGVYDTLPLSLVHFVPTLLFHLPPPSLPPTLISHQEELTKQAIQRAEEAEKEIRECKDRLTILEVAMQQQIRGTSGSTNLTLTTPDSLISPSTISLSLPLISNVSAISVPITAPVATSTALPVMTPTTTTTDDT